jgi:octaprenyl-diphosphate synthase
VANPVLVEQVRDLFGPKVDAVESALVAHLDDCPPHLREPALDMLSRGGKRLRPILHLLCADLAGHRGGRDVTYACVFEYVHVASLLHDDVIDEAELRRGGPSLNRKLGNTLSVLVGDYLCVKALSLAAAAGDPAITSLVSATTLQLVEGESLQELQSGRMDVGVDECLRVIELKTARLMAAACEAGAMLGRSPDGVTRAALREYGLRLGVAFQVADDLLDYSADEDVLGKPVLSDLASGKLTLPAVLALETGDARVRRVLARVMEDRGFERVSPDEVVDAVAAAGGLDAAARIAREAADQARAALVDLRHGPALDALEYATEFAVARSV